MIIAKIKGGLGNQLFQYAFGRAVQENASEPQQLLLDVSAYKYDAQRNFELGALNLNPNFQIEKTERYSKIYDERKNQIIRIAAKLAPKLTFKINSNRGVYIWNEKEYKPIEVGNYNNIFLNGYWQSYKYFFPILDSLVDEFTLSDTTQVENLAIYNSIKSSNAVCVHVRRGDYLTTSGYLVCPESYFLNAMREMEHRLTNPVFFVFSDDIPLVQQTINFSGHNIVYIKPGSSDIVEFEMMKACKSFIISNSTFSWWAAILSKSKNVIMPEEWYTDGTNPDYLQVPGWKMMELS